MKFKIHFTHGNTEDYVVITGVSIEDIRDRTSVWLDSRGLDYTENQCWSEPMDERRQ
jgi:hypothetical protein